MPAMSSSSSSLSTHLTLFSLLSLSSLYFLYKSRRLRNQRLSSSSQNPSPPKPKLFFASQTGTSKTLATRLFHLLQSNAIPFDLLDPSRYEPEDLPKETLILIVASTWENGNPPPNSEFLARWLSESAEDFRVGSLILSKCRFAVFGVGSGSYKSSFNRAAKDFARWLRALGAVELVPVGEGDVDEGYLDEKFDLWSGRVVRVLKGEEGGDDGVESDAFDGLEEEVDDYEEEEEVGGEEAAVDMEDIAGKAPLRKAGANLGNGVNGGTQNGSVNVENGPRDMVTLVIRASLVKQVIQSQCSS